MKNKRIVFLLTFIIILIHALGLFDAINDKILENFFILNKQKGLSPYVVIIEIDDKSINRIGNWPWPRKVYVELLNEIKKYPSVIGFVLSFTDLTLSEEDNTLYDILQSTNNIVLASKYTFKDFNNLTLAVPEKSIFPNVAQGHCLLDYSKKGVVVSIQPEKKYPAFSLAILDIFLKSNNKVLFSSSLKPLIEGLRNNKTSYTTNEHILIDYRRTPKQFKHYSFVDILNKTVNLDELKDKIVLIGITDKYKANTYVTPFTGSWTKTKSSTAVELQAQIIDSMINYRNLKECPILILNIISILITIIFFILIKNKSIILQGTYLIIFILLICSADFTLFKFFALWLPPAFPLALLILSFGLSEYFTSTKIDKALIDAINTLQNDNKIPLKKISTDIISKVNSLTSLLEIMNIDRNTIKSIIDGVDSGIIVFDKDGTIIWINEKIKNILNKDELLNSNISQSFEGLSIEEINNTILLNNSFKKELKIIDLEFNCIISKLNPDDNNYVAIFNDITEIKQIDRLKTDMVRMVSHELKNPLASIRICAENILFMKESNISVEHANRILNSTEYLVDTITNFLNLSKLENNLIEINITQTNIIDIINKSIELHSSQTERKNIVIKLEKDEIIPDVLVDDKLILIVMNVLISNAIKYSHNDSEILLKINAEGGKVRLSIIDYGIGIPENDLDRIFEKFYRSINNKMMNIEGTGLGLTIIKRILEIHNSNIIVKSEYGKGSTFTFEL